MSPQMSFRSMRTRIVITGSSRAGGPRMSRENESTAVSDLRGAETASWIVGKRNE
jgi:hypothetical protein